MGVHVVEQAAEMLADQIDLERPREVGVAEREDEVRHAGEHHRLVRHGVRGFRLAAVDAQPDSAEGRHGEPGRGDGDVGGQFLAGLQQDAGLGEPVDVVGDDRGPPGRGRLEQIAVGHHAQPLVPGGVARGEVGVDVEVPGELPAHVGDEQSAHEFRHAPAGLVDRAREQDVFAADHPVRPFVADQFPQRVGQGVMGRHREHIAG
ncbi:hypothetical protein L0F81_03315 [Streptomyces tricolor]|uniref:Uncharacterized protein n=1 Tax=Streptomyces tricolor TaxID=68277 RepID=A0ABS9J9T7_9ACTN|nr:hypothetical protein [Streptomyces tricolor]MCG0062327.1 hypothetical protein [Streptomyces tricolor]